MSERDGWVGEVYWMIEQHFDHPWHAHARALNERLHLPPQVAFSTGGPDEPPTFFNGDIDALQPGRWTLVVSLNPHHPLATNATSEPTPGRRFATPQDYWDFWRIMNTRDWHPHFFGPLVRVAAGALGDDVPAHAESAYATTRMLFIELCPYGSHQFGLNASQVAELAATDIGFRVARDIFRLAADEGHPALILVNGNTAVEALGTAEAGQVRWEETPYPSVSNPAKRLRHWEGTYRASHRTVPIAGFPFLTSIKGFNSRAEKAQLADYLKKLVARHGADTV